MSPEELKKLFRFMRSFSELNNAWTNIVWHGGEPMALPESYWKEIDRTLVGEFGSEIPPQSVQTNLYSLNSQRIERLRRMDTVGVSFDLYGGERLALNGRETEATVLANLDKLRAEGIPFGCISVVHRKNAHMIDTTFEFFNAAGITFRLLPFYRTDNPSQLDTYGLGPEEVVGIYARLFDLWLTRGKGVSIEPINRLVPIAMRHIAGIKAKTYVKAQSEKVIIVNTDGEVFSHANAYLDGWSYGSAFQQTATGIMGGAGRARNIAQARHRMAGACHTCPYFGACDGFLYAESTPEEPKDGCRIIRPTLDHIVRKLENLNDIQERIAVAGMEIGVDAMPAVA